MNEPTTQRSETRGKRHVKRLRVRRARKLCAAPTGRRRWLRYCAWSGGSVFAVVAAIAVTVYLLFSTGILTVDMARPYVESTLEARLGAGRTVQIGGIVADRAPHGGIILHAADITVRDDDGDVIATAPQAEVALQDSWLPWLMQPERVDLVGVRLNVFIDAQGQLSISTDGGGDSAGATVHPKALATVPASELAAVPEAAPAPAAEGVPAEAAALPGGAETVTPFGPLRLASLAALARQLDQGGLDGGKLSEIGLKEGVVIIRNEASGRQWTFDDIDLSLSRPAEGGVTFNITAGGMDGPWSARATVGALVDGQRDLELEVRDLAPRDLLIAAGKAGADILATSPLSVDLAATIDARGVVLATTGRLAAGAGELQVGPDADGRMLIDEAALAFSLDPAARRINLTSVTAQAGPFAMDLAGVVQMPADRAGNWQLQTRSARASFIGGGPHQSQVPPFVLDDIALDLSFDPVAQRATIDRGDLKGPQGGITLGGALDLGAPVPSLSMSVSATPMTVPSLIRLWPAVAAPAPRKWVYDHLISGEVSAAEISFDAPLDSIGNDDRPLADEALRINITGTNGRFIPVPGLPPIMDADVAVKITGRTAHVKVAKAAMQTPGDRRLDIGESIFDISDTAPDKPEAKVRVNVSGPAAAAIELAGIPPLRGPTYVPVEAQTVSGTIKGTAQISVKLSDNIQPSDIDYAFDATLDDFGASKMVLNQNLDDATVRAFVTQAATVARGQGKFGGAPASFDYSRSATGDMTFALAASLDDAARQKLGFELPGMSGTLGVKLNGVVGAKGKTADVELDLTGVKLADLVPGWTKPAGKPARMTAKAIMNASGTRLDDLVVTGQGVDIRGTVELDAKAALVSANLPTFQLSDGDKASVKLENNDGAYKVTVRGEVIQARAFLKQLTDKPVAGAGAAKPGDIDLDVKLGVVVGNNGETMREVALVISRRNGDLRAFSLAALVGREGGVTGNMRAQANGRPQLRVATSDAGALLRFIDLYPKIYGGDFWIDVDAPAGDGRPQTGVINMRDFVIRGEQGLDRLIAAAPATMRDGRPQPGSAISFRKLQVEFQRSAQQITLRDGAIWGPSIGSTFDGTLDLANDRVAVRGTYVPAYGLNNLFSRLPVLGFFLGGGPNEGLVGVTYEIVGPVSGPTLRVNPISAVAPGFLRKIFEFRQAPDPTPPAVVPTR
ncbi:AsmA-like C-terminal region-containing protein [Ancylobacter sp.]|uniref:YhdP family protein n=1 Tax=Ancylobacter sp. TaxID=1872567 RepID=UPI003D0D1DBF